MYKYFLIKGSKKFAAAISRGPLSHKSDSLKEVLTALTLCQDTLTDENLKTLLHRILMWKKNDPKEYKNRAIKEGGMGYQLWMEAKQLLKNNFLQSYSLKDIPEPSEPAGCPGTTLLGTYVPPGGAGEVCHAFTYRWLVARGWLRIDARCDPSNATVSIGPDSFKFRPELMKEILFPLANTIQPVSSVYHKVMENKILKIQRGDLVGFFNPHGLQHTMIVKDANKWFGVNNLGCFKDMGSERREVEVRSSDPAWVGDQWKHALQGGILDVVFRRFYYLI
jgi:hypothetical protein